MSTPERQQDSDTEKVTGYGGAQPGAQPDEPVEGSELVDFEPDDADADDDRDGDRNSDANHKGEEIPRRSRGAA